jgi:error-prone DNA polymerase
MPKTATGVTFVTLEDHTGNINIIVWLPIAMKFMKTLTTEKLVMVSGMLEKVPDNDVTHVIAKEIRGFSQLIQKLDVSSRNYH